MDRMTLPPPQLEMSWKAALHQEWEKPYLSSLLKFLREERGSFKAIYPSPPDVFAAFRHTPFEKVQVVIMGQDPYHGPGQAHGLSFSVQEGVKFPPSLKNIFKELSADLGVSTPKSGCLDGWAKQGVLMLNAVLTVREKTPHSHSGRGWELFTDAVVLSLAKRKDPVIFVLWGKSAQEKCQPILKSSSGQHSVLTAPHPSPFSAHSGFFGCKHFSKINELLKRQGKREIEWGPYG